MRLCNLEPVSSKFHTNDIKRQILYGASRTFNTSLTFLHMNDYHTVNPLSADISTFAPLAKSAASRYIGSSVDHN
jgi:hypothetical protein